MRSMPTALVALWIGFYLYWIISALAAKKNARLNRSYALVRFIIIVIFIVLFSSSRTLREFAVTVPPNLAINLLGLVLTVCGLGFAVWARIYLGRNWGMPMSLKENPELVTSGPYQYVRHPIYTGILLALLGSSLAAGMLWLIIFLFFGAYFMIAAKGEEKLMAEQFPDQYPEYKKRTKAMIPFVW